MQPPSTHEFTTLGLILVTLIFIRAILAVLGSQLHLHIARHNLVRESKLKRIEYMDELARRADDSIEIEEDEPAEDAGPREPMSQAQPEPMPEGPEGVKINSGELPGSSRMAA